MRKYLLFIILLSGLCLGARGQSDPEIDLSGLPQQTTAKSLRYWFDTDASSVKTASISASATSIDASTLVEGIHTVHYQIVDSKDIAGTPASKMFIKLDQRITAKSKSLRYWFDTDANSIKTTTTLSGATSIDASALVEGIHTVHYQIIDDQGIANTTASKMFIKIDAKVNTKASKLQYWFDTDKKTLVETDLAEIQNIDASKLIEGIHTLHYQIIDDKGNADIPVSKMFFKTSVKPTVKVKSLRYWFDDDTDVIETDFAEVVFVATDKLKSNGTHELRFQLVTDQDEVTPASTVSFEYEGPIPGDADGDGFVDVNDVTSTINHILNKPVATFIEKAADMDNDGKIDVNDVQAIIYKALGK